MPKPFNARRTLRRLGAPLAFETRPSSCARRKSGEWHGRRARDQAQATLNLICGRGKVLCPLLDIAALGFVEPILNQFV
jgi:hypothetical protein